MSKMAYAHSMFFIFFPFLSLFTKTLFILGGVSLLNPVGMIKVRLTGFNDLATGAVIPNFDLMVLA